MKLLEEKVLRYWFRAQKKKCLNFMKKKKSVKFECLDDELETEILVNWLNLRKR